MTTFPDTSASPSPQSLTLEQIIHGAEGDIVLSEPGKELIRMTAFTTRQKVGAYAGRESRTMRYPGDPVLVYRQG